MRFGMFGIYGVYNFGCEAIVRGTTAFLRMLYPGCQLTYFSRNFEWDKKALNDLDIEIVQVEPKNGFCKKVVNKLSWITGTEYRIPPYDYRPVVKDMDALFFIGGDIYTIPAVDREQAKYRYVNELVEFGKIAVKKKIPIILYGASVGPFGTYGRAVRYYRNALEKYRMIICRENTTINYLNSMGLENVVFSADPAFLVKAAEDKQVPRCGKYIGVNLSPLSLNELYGSNKENQIDRILELLRTIYTTFGYDILLLPHVVSADVNDNDYEFMKAIVEKMDSEMRTHFIMADYSGGFLGIKNQLLECKMVVSARMHCAINAIHESIPTILLSYSQKSIGMCEYVYGTNKWVVDIKRMEHELVPAMQNMLSSYETITHQLIIRNKEIQRYLIDNRVAITQQLSLEDKNA